MTNQKEDKNDVCNDRMGLVPYKICEKFYVENFTMAARIESDVEDSEVKNEQDNYPSDSGSDISVSTVNTEDLSDLSFSEDEDNGIKTNMPVVAGFVFRHFTRCKVKSFISP